VTQMSVFICIFYFVFFTFVLLYNNYIIILVFLLFVGGNSRDAKVKVKAYYIK